MIGGEGDGVNLLDIDVKMVVAAPARGLVFLDPRPLQTGRRRRRGWWRRRIYTTRIETCYKSRTAAGPAAPLSASNDATIPAPPDAIRPGIGW